MSLLYEKTKKLMLDGDIDMLADNIKAVLIDTDDYTVDGVNHAFLSNIPAAARVATSGNLTGKTTNQGVFDADNVTLTAVTGDVCEAVILYKDTGSPSTSPLIVYLDSGNGLPVIPNGGDITLSWDNGPNKIFKL